MFITIEGIDGAGKTTQATMLKEVLTKMLEREVIITREPAGKEVGKLNAMVREIVVNDEDAYPISELFLIYAARKEHVEKLIRPSLMEGKIVICDRFYDSSIAYFAYRDTLEKAYNLVEYLHKTSLGNLMPDATFLIDSYPQESKKRLARRGAFGKFDSMSIEEMDTVRSIFLDIAKRDSHRVTVVNGNQSPDKITELIMHEIVRKFPQIPNSSLGLGISRITDTPTTITSKALA